MELPFLIPEQLGNHLYFTSELGRTLVESAQDLKKGLVP